jgi:uncharacterized membrane protein
MSVRIKRLIMVDVDEIFVGERGKSMKKDDVEEILEKKKRIKKMVKGFRLKLGL